MQVQTVKLLLKKPLIQILHLQSLYKQIQGTAKYVVQELNKSKAKAQKVLKKPIFKSIENPEEE